MTDFFFFAKQKLFFLRRFCRGKNGILSSHEIKHRKEVEMLVFIVYFDKSIIFPVIKILVTYNI